MQIFRNSRSLMNFPRERCQQELGIIGFETFRHPASELQNHSFLRISHSFYDFVKIVLAISTFISYLTTE